jgi:Tfp pilus assembly protein PilO
MIDLQDILNRHREKILYPLVSVLVLIAALNIFKSQSLRAQFLKKQVKQETDKNEVIATISQSEKTIASYRDLLNKKDISTMMNTLTAIAKAQNLYIVSMKPAAVENYPVYQKYPVSLIIHSLSYHALGKFINAVEKHPDMYIIDKMSIRPVDSDTVEYSVVMDIQLSTVIFKDKG